MFLLAAFRVQMFFLLTATAASTPVRAFRLRRFIPRPALILKWPPFVHGLDSLSPGPGTLFPVLLHALVLKGACKLVNGLASERRVCAGNTRQLPARHIQPDLQLLDEGQLQSFRHKNPLFVVALLSDDCHRIRGPDLHVLRSPRPENSMILVPAQIGLA